MLFQTRRGLERFLGLRSATQVIATGPPLPLLPSPLILQGNATAPWVFSPFTPSTSFTAFALNLRSMDDNSTRIKIEISADVRSAVQAASSVTSIARHVPSTSSDPPPVYATKSNIVVSDDSQFQHSTNQLTLLLRLHPSTLTQKDTSQPCVHCQNLFSYCASHAACQALSSCVLRDGLEAEQIPATLLQVPSLTAPAVATADASPVLRRCLSAPLTSSSLDALLLFTSAVRCQLQRMCAFRKPSDYGLQRGLDDRLLLWEATEGVLRLNVPSTVDTSTSLRLGSTVLCSFSAGAFSAPQRIQEWIPRHCQFASYLGHVTLNVNSSSPSSPLTSATVAALPSIYLRVDKADFATALLPTPPSSPPARSCTTRCSHLALDGCLRDLACVAFTVCIVRHIPSSSMGDAILAFFEQAALAVTLSSSATH